VHLPHGPVKVSLGYSSVTFVSHNQCIFGFQKRITIDGKRNLLGKLKQFPSKMQQLLLIKLNMYDCEIELLQLLRLVFNEKYIDIDRL